MESQILNSYFPQLTDSQLEKFEMLLPLYRYWNEKINVVSRKDIDQLYIHHVLHSLTVIPFYPLVNKGEILDLGTGGGFPGIPLSIYYPETSFTMIDGTSKKIMVVNEIIRELGLENARAFAQRAEDTRFKFDMVLTRGVSSIQQLLFWARPLLKKKHLHAFPNGLIAFKGGDLRKEIKELGRGEYYEKRTIYEVFPVEHFKEKYIIYVQG